MLQRLAPVKTPRTIVEFLEQRILLSLAGNQLFPADNPWNHPISDAPVVANSATLVNSIGATLPLHPDFGTTYGGASNGIPYSVVNGTQPAVPIIIDDYPDESDIVPIPMPANPVIEGEAPGGSADFISLPSYAQFTIAGDQDSTWDSQTTDPRALADPLTGVIQSASTWSSGTSFSINLNLTDGLAHRIALYMVDFDSLGRSQSVSIINPANNQVLATQSVSKLSNGEYLIFDVTGDVQLQFTNTGNSNLSAVLSGLFFGAPGSPSIPNSTSATAAFVGTDTTTRGNWIGTYGAAGYSLAPFEDDGDRHLIVYDTANQTDYELFEAYPPSEEPDGQWHAASEAVWNMAADSFRPPGWTSADAAGLPILPGLVRADEVLTQGAITHALRFTVPATYDAYVYPASHNTNGTNPNDPRMGERFRLNPSFNISSFSAADQVILQALKTYGMIVADNGSSWYLSGAPSTQWSDDDLHNLTQVIGSDFQAVNLTPVVTSINQITGPAGGGTSVTVNGINFSGVAGNIQVNFGTVAGTNVNVLNDNTLTVTAPPHAAGTADITVVTPYGTSATLSADRFTFNTAAISTWIINSSGNWNTPGNWNNGIPNSAGTEADFLKAITSAQTVSSSTGVTADVVRLDNSNSYNLAGTGSLILQSASGSALLYAQAGVQSITLPITIAGNSQFNVDGGASLIINAPITYNTGSTLTLSIANASSFTLASHGTNSPQVLQLSSLSITPGGTLNLTNNDLDILQGNLATLTALIGQAYNNGAWSGAGITSGTAAADASHLTALGVILNTANGSAPLYGSGTPLGTFDGTSPAPSDVLAKYTYYGDTNLDGKVDGSDYARIDNGYLTHLTGWFNGDFNYDGVVNGSDYTLIDNAFNSQGARFLAQVAAAPKKATTPAFPADPLVTSPSTDPWLTDALKKLKQHRANSIFAESVR